MIEGVAIGEFASIGQAYSNAIVRHPCGGLEKPPVTLGRDDRSGPDVKDPEVAIPLDTAGRDMEFVAFLTLHRLHCVATQFFDPYLANSPHFAILAEGLRRRKRNGTWVNTSPWRGL